MVGGLVLGVVEIETTTLASSDLKDFVAFAVLLAVLLVRPQGIFGRPVLRRV
jgi:branched-chain amino acid transport system permease protein